MGLVEIIRFKEVQFLHHIRGHYFMTYDRDFGLVTKSFRKNQLFIYILPISKNDFLSNGNSEKRSVL